MADNSKYQPPAYPAQAHYDAGPYQGPGSPPPGGQIQPYQSEQFDQSRGYNQGYNQGYGPAPGQPMPNGGYYNGPPQGYYQGQPQMQYYQQGPPPQGYYANQRGPGAGEGCCAALLASLACCCCLDLLI